MRPLQSANADFCVQLQKRTAFTSHYNSIYSRLFNFSSYIFIKKFRQAIEKVNLLPVFSENIHPETVCRCSFFYHREAAATLISFIQRKLITRDTVMRTARLNPAPPGKSGISNFIRSFTYSSAWPSCKRLRSIKNAVFLLFFAKKIKVINFGTTILSQRNTIRFNPHGGWIARKVPQAV